MDETSGSDDPVSASPAASAGPGGTTGGKDRDEIDVILDSELPRFAEALRRLGE